MSMNRLLVAACACCFGVLVAAQPAPAADFRVENAVYVEGQSQPQSQGVTIFHQGVVYDFLTEPPEVIVFDKAHRRFLLLDINHRRWSEISTDDVRAVADRVKQRLAGHPNPKSRWLVNPTFEESFDRDSAELTLKSDSLTYRAKLQTTEPAVAAQYHEFSDWYTQFNLALNPSSRPPFPRMMLNEAIERHESVAKEVHLTANVGPNDAQLKIASRHELATELSANDLKRLEEVRHDLQSFQAVSLREYRGK